MVSASQLAEPRAGSESQIDAGYWVAACGRPDPGEPRGSSDRDLAVATDGRGRTLRVFGAPGTALTAGAESVPCGLIFDGVIYNRAEVRGALADGQGPIANDAELMLRAYLRWGEEAVRRVKGVFALAIWDGRHDVLLCARDRMGFYPLFYARAGREVLVSLSSEALARHPGVSAALNLPALADSLCNRYHDIEETFYTGIRRVPQGHVVRIPAGARQGDPAGYRYWNPTPTSADVNWIRDDHVERFNEALDQAVSRVLGLGPVGIFLSGGLDSVSVAAVAAENARAQGMPAPFGLSLIFPDPECYEEPVQRGVSKSLGLPHLLVPFEEAAGGEGPMMAALELCRTFPAPLMSLWQPAYLYLGAEGRRRGCRSILTGGGGDEWLSVSPFLAADLMRALDVRGLYRLYRNLARSYPLPRLALLRNVLWASGARPLLTGAGAAVLRAVAPGVLHARRLRYIAQTTPPYIAPDAALRREMDRRADRYLPEPTVEDFYWRQGQHGLSHALVSLEAEEVFESARRAGVRQFATFMDADLIDTLMRIPPEVLNRGGRSKGLVREAMARRFPQLGFERQKKVMALSYYRALVRREVRTAWKAMGGVPTLAELGIVNGELFASAVDRIISDEQMRGEFRIWSLLSLEAWARARV